MNLIEQAKEVKADYKGGAHFKDIAQMILDAFPIIKTNPDKFAKRVGAVLSTDARKKGTKSSFARVKGKKKGSFRKGLYRLKRKPVVKLTPTLPPNITNQYTGKAGETAVIAELLFYGYNASGMAVDDGIDVIASKENKFYHIQVKTANPSETGLFGFSIRKNSFIAKDSSQTFYIFVLRKHDKFRYYNDYLILPSSQIRQLVAVGIINEGAHYSIRIQKDKRGRYILNAKQYVTISVNTFSQIV